MNSGDAWPASERVIIDHQDVAAPRDCGAC